MSDDPRLVPSISGATVECSECGTIFDNHGFDIEDYVPPIGDGCEFCMPENFDDDSEDSDDH